MLKNYFVFAVATFTLASLIIQDASARTRRYSRNNTPSVATIPAPAPAPPRFDFPAPTPVPAPSPVATTPPTPAPVPCPVASPPPYVPGMQCTASTFNYNGQVCPFQSCDFPLLNMLYTRLLNRAPDAAGKQYWIGELSKGMSCADVAKNFVYSTEFQLLQAGLSDVDYTIRIYAGLLNRVPDSGGYAYWLGAIQTGYPRNSFAESVILSSEFGSLCNSMGFGPFGIVPPIH